MAKLAVFDIDNTLTESRSKISPETARLLSDLIDRMPVALISGGSMEDFEKQIISGLSHSRMENLYALPTSGAELRVYKDGSWQKVYSYPISDHKKRHIFEGLARVTGLSPVKLGHHIYDRGSQITFSALGKDAPLDLKYAWDPTRDKRRAIISSLKPRISGISMTIGGSTSIDFTEEGIDKAFGVGKLLGHLKIEPKDAVFVGDALTPGGNDEPVRALGVVAVPTKGPSETEKIIGKLISETEFHRT